MNPRQQRPPAVWLVHRAFGKWDALLAEPAPASDRVYVSAVWHYLRGSAYLNRNELDKAEEELRFVTTASVDSAVKGVLSGANPARTILEMLADALTGEIAMSRGHSADAVEAFREAVRLQDSLTYNEPPDWPQSMRLHLGEALMKTNRAKEAEAVYREDLRDFQQNGWALFGLWQSLRAQGKSTEAEHVRGQFKRAWKNADVTLAATVF
jgi:tetratricopeptide (TPR) repeat protein